MQPVLEKVSSYQNSSFAVKRDEVPYMPYPWHYHPEYEIIFVEKSYGVRLMGDSIENFNDGDTVFIGSGLPHVWRNDEDYYKGNPDKMVDVYVIHFKEDAFGRGIFDLAETQHIKELFERGKRAMKFHGPSRKHIADKVKQVYQSSGIKRVLLILELLDFMARSSEFRYLSSPGFSNSVNITDSRKNPKDIRVYL